LENTKEETTRETSGGGGLHEEPNLSGGIKVDYGIAYGEGNLEDKAE
jgi:hypothetical protein